MELTLLNTRMQRSLIARLLSIPFCELEVITTNTVMNCTEQPLTLSTQVHGIWSPSFGLRPLVSEQPLHNVFDAAWALSQTPVCKMEGGCLVLRTLDLCNDKFESRYQLLPMEVFADYVMWLGDMCDAA